MPRDYTGQYKLRTLVLIILMALAGVLMPALAGAAAISRSYHVDGRPSKGSLVSLDATNPGVGHLANIGSTSDLLGTVVAQNDSLLVINPADGTVEVAIGGTAPVLVSTINGDIKVGDYISVSPLIGVGMKAEAGLPVIGRAQTDFNGRTENGSSRRVTDKEGKTRDVQVGFVNVEIKVNNSRDGATSINSLQKIVQSLTGRVIATVRIILSLVIAVITIVTLVILVYASIFGSIISIGRNPLAKSAILGSLRSVLLLALLLTVVAGISVILLLS